MKKTKFVLAVITFASLAGLRVLPKPNCDGWLPTHRADAAAQDGIPAIRHSAYWGISILAA